ncbi:MAG: hypothetical protein RLZZ366_2023, partial [Pseudomonadota bacterium]
VLADAMLRATIVGTEKAKVALKTRAWAS